MVDYFPIPDLTTPVVAASSGHLSRHTAEGTAYNTLKSLVSAYGIAPLDLFAIGGSDSDKLDAAIAYCGGLGGTAFKPTIQLGLRQYEFTRSIGRPYDGFRLEGVSRGQVHQKSSTTPNQQTTVKLTLPIRSGGTTGCWINVEDEAWGYRIGGFNGYSDQTTTQVYRAPYQGGSVKGLREASLFEQTWQNVSVFGNSSEAIALTICDIIGGWGIYTPYDSPVNIQGSDCRNIFGQGLDLYTIGTNGNGKYLINLNSLGKSHVGPIYLTAAGTWQGMRIQGGTQAGLLDMAGAVLEGNNAGQACMGSLLRIDSGNVSIRDTTIDDGMAAPTGTASANGGTASRGLVEIGSSAQVNLDTIAWAHATGVATNTPVVYNSSPKLSVGNFQTFTRGPDWGTQLPVVAGVAPRSVNDGSWVAG